VKSSSDLLYLFIGVLVIVVILSISMFNSEALNEIQSDEIYANVTVEIGNATNSTLAIHDADNTSVWTAINNINTTVGNITFNTTGLFNLSITDYNITVDQIAANNITGALDCSNVTGASYNVCTGDGSGLSAIYTGNDYAYITGGDTVNVNETKLNNTYVPYTGADATLNLGDETILYNNINLSNQQVTYVPITGNIQTYIDDSNEGDILVLSTGTYIIPATIDSANGLTLMGQGKDKTFLEGTNLANGMFYIQQSNTTIRDLTINTTSANVYSAILFSGKWAGTLENMKIINVDIDASVSNPTSRIINFANSDGFVENVNINSNSTSGRNWGLLFEGQASMERDSYAIVKNTHIENTGVTAGTYSIMSWDNGASNDIHVDVYDSSFHSSSGGLFSSGAYITGYNNIFNAYNSYFEGYTYDTRSTSAQVAKLHGCTLGNGNNQYMTFAPITGTELSLYTSGTYSGNLQNWYSRQNAASYNLKFRAETISGVVRYIFDLTNNAGLYSNLFVLDRDGVGINKIPETDMALDVNGNVSIEGDLYVSTGFTGDCINTTFVSGIAISCND
jgi:hypothetical protein